jgi:hypothetical protein
MLRRAKSQLAHAPGADSKNEPHQGKKTSFFFQCGRAITWKHTSAASGAKIQLHNAMKRWRLCSASARAQPRKGNKETTIKMMFSFPPEERVSFSQPRKDDGARVATSRAPSQLLSTRGMGQHNNQKGAIDAKERQQRNNNQNGMFFSS